jgi:hypothetical protein
MLAALETSRDPLGWCKSMLTPRIRYRSNLGNDRVHLTERLGTHFEESTP